jgi:thiamine biosynthesis lipoprotein
MHSGIAVDAGMPMQTATEPNTRPSIDRLGGETMGTTWSVQWVAPERDLGSDSRQRLHVLHARAQACLDRVIAQMSHWEADSDLSRFNRADAGWVRLPDALMEVLACALDIARTSDGAFDPTLGELSALWGFGPGGPVPAPPSPDRLEAARERAGWEQLRLDRDASRAYQPGGLQLDLSAIAKGHAVDRIVTSLQEAGVPAALVEVGGELRAYGRKAGGACWRVLVETAHDIDAELLAEVVVLDDCAVATSGDRWHRFRHAGMDYAHTLDPRTGAPLLQAPLAATVIADQAMHADAWATALSVLPRDAALALAAREDIALRLIGCGDAAVEIARTAAFTRRMAA